MGYHAMLDIRNKHSLEREKLLAGAVKEVAAELRLVDVADYVAFLRMDQLGNIADLVESSSQLYLRPGALIFGNGGDIHLTWGTPPSIDLDLEFRSEGVTAHFRLGLTATNASVRITYIAFAEPDAAPEANTERLRAAIESARYHPAR
ncbi:hypothetical protein [Aureimonas populi]|uniref:DUF3806 domain-containing protein n=1 Tax=Aureimonas populi TaxID=1701758 RepID=A0ABW5CGH7_9HYPH|nr:hypothetical protein [Aureimonas populi]